MTATCQTDADRRLVRATARGILTRSDLAAYVRTVLDGSGTRGGFDALIDLTAIQRVDVTETEVGDAVSLVARFDTRRGRSRTALVASDDNVDEIVRLVEILRPRVPAILQVFSEAEAAQAWLLAPIRETGRSTRERRAAPRKALELAALIHAGDDSRPGSLVNISVSGARLRCGKPLPGVGSPVEIHVEPGGTPPIDIAGRTVRLTEDGFAMQFDRVTTELLQLVGDPF
jgi:hypothetical protein